METTQDSEDTLSAQGSQPQPASSQLGIESSAAENIDDGGDDDGEILDALVQSLSPPEEMPYQHSSPPATAVPPPAPPRTAASTSPSRSSATSSHVVDLSSPDRAPPPLSKRSRDDPDGYSYPAPAPTEKRQRVFVVDDGDESDIALLHQLPKEADEERRQMEEDAEMARLLQEEWADE
ncbi:hypothetical protein BDK51DRAFT_25818 [Blyttiomyces helicus]|uniref:Uncharacterized protein n=1 Tax=Blyttiomyces helicus TaxID=388810 RepID=A0A4P9WHA3_9FUNG|nr:hypothetical protein BDK51DRAFT_25818 [Blyttiomyces helicus]|eukprot:RKO91752.1 hypothetical protein BDK51DRAFT_25818 [Blyttiomyces helicus]